MVWDMFIVNNKDPKNDAADVVFDVFLTVDFKHIPHLFLVFLLLNLMFICWEQFWNYPISYHRSPYLNFLYSLENAALYW